jgi:hypothetical protein
VRLETGSLIIMVLLLTGSGPFVPNIFIIKPETVVSDYSSMFVVLLCVVSTPKKLTYAKKCLGGFKNKNLTYQLASICVISFMVSLYLIIQITI